MRASEIFISILNIGSIFIGISAAAYGFVSYIQTYSRAKSIGISTIGRLNLVICLSVLISILSVYILSSSNNTSFFVHSTLVSILLIGSFIAFQTFYLFSSKSPVKYLISQQNSNNQHSQSTLEVLHDIEQRYRDYLQNNLLLQSLQIFNMSFPLKTTKMYIPTKVYPELLQFSPEQIEMLEEQFTPLDRLNKKLEILEKRNEEAIYPLQVIVDQNKKQCILIGDPGIGKTTYLKYLTISLASKTEGTTGNLLPIYIRLNDYANSKKGPLFDYIVEIYRNKYFSSFEEKYLRKLLKNKLIDGTAFIMLDGLDETLIGSSAKTTYKEVCDRIATFAGEYENAYIIVTSRKSSYEDGEKLIIKDSKLQGREFKCLEIVGFLRNDVRSFVKHWFEEWPSNDEEISAENLLLKLEQDSRLRELSSNPLLLSKLTLAYARKMKITHRRAKLYDDCISALLKDWDKSRTIERTNEKLLSIQNELPALTLDILKELAWHFHNLELSYFSREEALKIIEIPLARKNIPFALKDEILQEIINNSGLLKQDSEYSFSHITFQEYFAAKYMVDSDKNGRSQTIDVLNKWYDPWWEEIILLYAGLTAQLSPLLENLLHQKDDIFYSNTFFAARCIAATDVQSQQTTINVIQKLYGIFKEDALDEFTSTLQKYVTKHQVDNAANALIEIANHAINLSLLKLLGVSIDDKSIHKDAFWVSEEVVKNISKQGCASIAEALGTCSDQSVPGLLRELLVHGQAVNDVTIESSIAYALGKLGDKSVSEDLVNYLYRSSRSGNSTDLHISIIDALRSLRDPSVIPVLCDCLSRSNINRDEKIRIAHTLGVLGPLIISEDIEALLSKTLLAAIANQKTSADVLVGCACIGTFGQWGYTKANPELQRLLQVTDSWPLCSRISVILTLLGEESIQPNVSSFLSDEKVDKNIRNELIHFLEDQLQLMPERNDSSLIPNLMQLIKNDEINPNVRGELAETLGKTGNEKVGKQFLEYLAIKNLNQFVRSKIVLALGSLCGRGKIRDTELFPILQDLLVIKDKDQQFILNPNTHITIISSCVEVIDEIGMLRDRWFTRNPLLRYIQLAKKQEILEEHRANLIIMLGTLGDKTASNDLKKLLLEEKLDNDTIIHLSVEMREKIVKALIKLKDTSIVPELLNKLRDNTFSLDIRISLIKIIKSIANDEETCKTLLNDLEQVQLPELQEKIYQAIWEISRRAGFRVFKNPDSTSSIAEVEKMEPLSPELPATASS